MDFVRHDLQEFTDATGDALKQTSHALKDTVQYELRFTFTLI